MEHWQLEQMQGLPLEIKIQKALLRIREWYEYWNGNVYVSYSGGKDSIVLLHLIRSIYTDVPAVFVNTGLEFPELVQSVRDTKNVIWLKPSMSFEKVVKKYGYPVISKQQASAIYKLRNHNLTDTYRNKLLYGDERGIAGKLSDKWHYLKYAPFKISDACCAVMKKRPLDKYTKETGRMPFVGELAAENQGRKLVYLRTGCNAFNNAKPRSKPLGPWLDDNIWQYINIYDLSYPSVYDIGESRTG